MLRFCNCWYWAFSALIIIWQYCDDSQMKNNSKAKAVDSYRYDIFWQIIFAIVMIIGILACLLIPENVNHAFYLAQAGCWVVL